jgi:hypothetical protein
MDTLGPRIMVNVGTQAVSNTGRNPRDLAPLTNDAFLATFMGKTSLSASNGISRQHNNYRQSYTTQMERVTLRSKSRPFTSNGDSIEPDSAILSIIRGTGSDSHQQVRISCCFYSGEYFFSFSNHLNDNYKVIVIVVVHLINNLMVVGTIYLVHQIIDQQMTQIVDVVHVLVVHNNK